MYRRKIRILAESLERRLIENTQRRMDQYTDKF